MTLPRIKLIWGGAKQIPGHWRLGLWGVFERQVGSRPRVAVSVRGVLSWLLGLALAGYLAGATALYFWFERNPYNLVKWSDTLLLPLRWDEVRELRGRMIIAEGLEDLRAKRWGEAHMKLRVGVARAPAELRARLALAEFYTAANQRPAAIELLNAGLGYGYPGRQYLTTLFGLAAQSEDFDTIVAACARLQPPDHGERAWLVGQNVSALIAAHRAAEALALTAAPGEGGSAQLREGRVLALIEMGRAGEAIGYLAEWRAETGAVNRAQILRLEARAFREAGRLDEMEAALEGVRTLAPADPRSYVYGVVQRYLAGRTAGAALDDYFRRFAGTAQNLLLAATALAEAKATPQVARCVAEAGAHGFPLKTFQLTLVQAQLEAGDWSGAAATLAAVKPQLTGANLAEQFSFDWMVRLTAVATQSDAAPESALLALLQQRTLPLRLYRQTAEVLLRAGRPAAAKNVAELGGRAYPVSRTLARLRAEADAALQVAVNVPAERTDAARGVSVVVTERDFFAELQRFEAKEKWIDAAQAIRRMRVAKPAWLGRREADLLDAQMRVAIQTMDTLELLGAAKQYLNGDRERAERVLVLARELGASGRKVDGERLIVEVLRKNADFPPALRLRKEWEPAADR